MNGMIIDPNRLPKSKIASLSSSLGARGIYLLLVILILIGLPVLMAVLAD
jgi:hypothetical protein